MAMVNTQFIKCCAYVVYLFLYLFKKFNLKKILFTNLATLCLTLLFYIPYTSTKNVH